MNNSSVKTGNIMFSAGYNHVRGCCGNGSHQAFSEIMTEATFVNVRLLSGPFLTQLTNAQLQSNTVLKMTG